MCFSLCFKDINECEANTYPCHKNASCDNTIGSYECTCEDGFHGNGTTCEGSFISLKISMD